MKRFIKTLLSLAIAICPIWAFSKPIQYEIRVEKVECLKTSEYKSDEIYFSIKSVDDERKTDYYRIPKFPFHIPIKKDESVSDILLIKNSINDNSSINFTISLVENDISNFEMDDPLGSATLTLHNKDGQLVSTWQSPEDGKKVDPPKFKMTGDNSDYIVQFTVKEITK